MRIGSLRTALAATALAAGVGIAGAQQDDRPRSALPVPDAPFGGVSNRTLAGSRPDYPTPVAAPKGAPNVLLVLIDDAGFGNPSTFGGPCQTPTLSKLASQGLRYNRFHVTALCSPTRAALLSGRNHHAVGFGSIAEFAGGWPGYNATWPKSAAGVAQILQANGYSTAAFGKWHLTPDDQQGAAGPFDRWPCGLGFDYFYGFLGGASGQYDPVLAENNKVIGVPKGKGYYLPDDLTDRTITWIHDQKIQAPDRPFFIYYATGATHSPHHVPKEWADRYKGKFDQGWDRLREETFARQKALGVIPANAKLTPRDPAFPAWDGLSPDEKKLYARQMEVYAGFQENTDHQVGRVVEALEAMGQADNTLVLYIWGDNGSSMEGTETGTFNELTTLSGIPLTPGQQMKLMDAYGGIDAWGGPVMQPHFACAWAWAGNTPFRWGKQVASHLGGTRNPMVVSWPRRIRDRGGIRSQFSHVIDVTPTILEAAGIAAPSRFNGIEQMPIHGTSFAYTFDDAAAKERHTQQYFEIFGNRALYKDGWIACARIDRIPWRLDPATAARLAPGKYDPEQDRWELYNLAEDFSESEDLAAKYPEKLRELQQLFWQDAETYHVTPLLAGFSKFFGINPPQAGRKSYAFFPDSENIGSGMIPPIYNESYSIAADVEVPEAGAEGVIVAESDVMGGFSLYVQDRKLKYTYSFLGLQVETLAAAEDLPAGRVKIRLEFAADEPGKLGTGGRNRLFVGDRLVAEGRLEHTCPMRFTTYAGMDIGKDNGEPVVPSYAARSPFAFTGKIGAVVFDLGPAAAPR
ncbi:Arylsulfatase [Aquisphaera giovannonii]|uniref:Arylsulfatase n=1 Tax=Aquisphaera giovannonii TaxID=406548 RepID=A0A5B9WDS5_9BACT|nr:arylsulfatase [Aquisphaera giovannonii]QEH38225.1 Arylsulfatase [Aquisphaera giovannonii]